MGRKFILLPASAMMLTLVTAAVAADMPIKASPPPATFSWTGFYAGLNVGGSWGGADNTYAFVPATGATSPIGSDSSHPTGAIGGGQLGYNWQSGSVVFGIETDIQGSSESSTASATCVPCFGTVVTETDKLTWFGTTRGRLGVAPGPWLLYVTGGAAYGGLHSSGADVNAIQTIAFSNSATRLGWTAGAGVEGAFYGRWSWKLEYLYMDLGTANFATPAPPPSLPGNVTQSLHFTDNIVRAGLNLRF